MTSIVRRLLSDANEIPYENTTTRFWEYVFTRLVFTTPEWVISSQQPPTGDPHDLRRVDLMAEKMDRHRGTLTRMTYMEAKRARPTQQELVTVEYQGFTAGYAHCEHFGDDRISVMTCAGGYARLWVYERGGDYLTPWIPSTGGLGALDEYIEFGDEIMRGLRYIRDNRVPPARTLPSVSSPRPTRVNLPEGWYEIPTTSGVTSEPEQMSGVNLTPSYTSYATEHEPRYAPSSSNTQGAKSEYLVQYRGLDNYASSSSGTQGAQPEYMVQYQGSDIYASSSSGTQGAQPGYTAQSQSLNNSTPASSGVEKEGPCKVHLYKGRYEFHRKDGKLITTRKDEWEKASMSWESGWRDCWVYTGKSSGTQYYTFQLPK